MKDSVIAFDSHSECVTYWLKRIGNSDDAPGFGRYYHIVATDNETHQGLVVLCERYRSDELAKKAFNEFVLTKHETVAERLRWINENMC